MHRLLYHFSLSPAARKVRLVLREKNLEFELIDGFTNTLRDDIAKLNWQGEVPVLVEAEGYLIADANAICEYLEEKYAWPAAIPGPVLERAEIRRLVGWFDGKFARDVSLVLLDEKLLRRLRGQGGPNSSAIRHACSEISPHLDYLGWLLEQRSWLAGEHFSLADMTAAAHLSVVDYFGDVPWERFLGVKEWYARVKSRPSFRPLLSDRIAGMPAPAHYADLDF